MHSQRRSGRRQSNHRNKESKMSEESSGEQGETKPEKTSDIEDLLESDIDDHQSPSTNTNESVSSGKTLTFKREDGCTISIPVQQIQESDDSDIEVVDEIISQKLHCAFCKRSPFTRREEYHDHLSLIHFQPELLSRMKKNGKLLLCPKEKCEEKFHNNGEAVKHLGTRHKVVTQLIEESNLRETGSRKFSRSERIGLLDAFKQEPGGIPLEKVIKLQEQIRSQSEENCKDDVVEIEKQTCGFCDKNFELKLDLNTHIIINHITPRLEYELEKAGWEAGQEVCPACKLMEESIVLHWGLYHGGVDRAIAKLKGQGTYFVCMKSAREEVSRWMKKKNKSVSVNIKIEAFMREIASVMISDGIKRVDVENTNVEINQEEVGIADEYQESQKHNSTEIEPDKVEADCGKPEEIIDKGNKTEISTLDEIIDVTGVSRISENLPASEVCPADSEVCIEDACGETNTQENENDADKNIEKVSESSADLANDTTSIENTDDERKEVHDDCTKANEVPLSEQSAENNLVQTSNDQDNNQEIVDERDSTSEEITVAEEEKNDDTDDDIQVIYNIADEDKSDDKVSVTEDIAMEMGSIVSDFISGNIPQDKELDKIEKRIEKPPEGRKSLVKHQPKAGDGEVEILGAQHQKESVGAAAPAETCLICSNSFSSSKEFYIHLAQTHFKETLQKRLYHDSSSYSHGEWKCPTCKCYVTSDLDVMIDHYGAYCLPFPVKSMYLEFTMKRKDNSLSCVFCDDNVKDEDLLKHISAKHNNEIRYSMGMVWSFLVSGSREMCCPICYRVEPFATNGLVEHFLRDHSKDFQESLLEYREALKDGQAFDCLLCGRKFTAPQDCIHHLVLDHFQDSLFSECGLSQDGEFACSYCNFQCSNEQKIVLHYGIEHQRLNFWFTDRLLTLAKRKEVLLDGSVKKLKIEPDNYLKLAQFLSKDSGLSEELSARDFLLNTSNAVYNKCRNLVQRTPDGAFKCLICDLKLKNETLMVSHIATRPHEFAQYYAGLLVVQESRQLWCKICHKNCHTKADFQHHLMDSHFMDDLLLEARRHEATDEQNKGPAKYYCEDCPQSGLMSNVAMIEHRANVHKSVVNLYKHVQITPQILKCKLCPETNVFSTLAAFKHHLKDHFPQEMKSCLGVLNGSVTCMLCGKVICRAGENYDVGRHVAVKHNYLETLYQDEILVPASSETFKCELCRHTATNLDQFLVHITYTHVVQTMENFRNHINIKCPSCEIISSTFKMFIEHVGLSKNQCNYSLCRYYQIVDDSRNVKTTVKLHTEEYLVRLRKRYLAERSARRRKKGIFPSHYILPEGTPDFIEDPVSSKISLEISAYEGHVTVEFEKRLPMKSFKSSIKFERKDLPSCALCPLYRSHRDVPEGDNRAVWDAFVIHLANTHFKGELERMFASTSSKGEYMCCDEYFNFQTLIGHVKEEHSIISNMYRAVVPKPFPNLDFSAEKRQIRHPQYISHMMPWLPSSFTQIRKVVKNQSGMDCKLCNLKIPGIKKDLNKHYVLAHFQAELESTYVNLLRSPPYKCPKPGCKFVPLNHYNAHKEELFLHMANKHREIENLLASSFNNIQKFKDQSSSAQSVNFMKPVLSKPSSQTKPDKPCTSTFVSPKPFQCLSCHADMGNLFNLAHHMRSSKHVNISWALQSNILSKEERSHVSNAGLWFQKLDLRFRCSYCVKKAAISMAINNFNTLEDVFVHICEVHREFFQTKYPETVISFCLCKICNGFIDLKGIDAEEDRRQVEYNHYLTHGRLFVVHAGIVKRKEASYHICMLCNEIFKSWEFFAVHLKKLHTVQVISTYREFSMPEDLQPLDRCCICKQSDTSGGHLSSHNKQILVEMGLIEVHVKDHKSSRITCCACNFVDKNCLKIIEHFSTAHKELLLFIQNDFDKQNSALDTEIPVHKRQDKGYSKGEGTQQSLLKNSIKAEINKFHYTCIDCSISFGENSISLKRHLINKHYYSKILEQATDLIKTSSICPECGGGTSVVYLHYWIEHVIKKGVESVKEPVFDGRNLWCTLCDGNGKGMQVKDMYTYYTHMYWIHYNEQSREAIRSKVESEQARNSFVHCPENDCHHKNDSEEELVMHCGLQHDYLESLLHKENRLAILAKKDRTQVPSTLNDEIYQEPKTCTESFEPTPLPIGLNSPEKTRQVSINANATVQVVTVGEWKSANRCSVCEKSLAKLSLFQRKTHYLDHFRVSFPDFMKSKMPSYFVNKNCEPCNVKFKDDQTLFMHFGTEHGLFDHFLRERAKSGQFAYSSEYQKFLTVRSVKTSPKSKKAPTGEKCKLCDKVFETMKSTGQERKPNEISSERFHHYLSHFRDLLMQENAKAFGNTTPMKCCNCPYYTVNIKSCRKEDHTHAMLIHVAKCQRRLETLIQNIKPRQSAIRCSVIVKPKPAEPTIQDWNKVDYCILCPDHRSMKDHDKKTHYIRHFVEELRLVCKDSLSDLRSRELIVCPLCKVQIERGNVTHEDFLLQFFQHVGFYHAIVPRMFLTRTHIEVESHTLTAIQTVLKDRFWAIKSGNCLVCSEDLSGLKSAERANHYYDHLSSVVIRLEEADKCYLCNYIPSEVRDYLLHVLSTHLNIETKMNIKLRLDGDFQCCHCKFSSTNATDVLKHLVNEELFLYILIMIDMKKSTEESQSDNQEGLIKATNDQQSTFLECKLCKKFFKENDIFNKHLYVRHFKREIDQKKGNYFDQVNAAVTNVKCKSCGQLVNVNETGLHIVYHHEDVQTTYRKHVDDEPDARDAYDESTKHENRIELTTLGEDSEYAKVLERDLRAMKISKECFIQNVPCYMFAEKLPPCHECKKIQQGANYALSGTCCCFEGFRKIRFLKDGKLIVVGYLNPDEDPRSNDVDIWAPKLDITEDDLSVEEAFFILQMVGDLLCEIVAEENMIKESFIACGRSVVWKRPHQGVREMCDVCSTSIYNLHLTCSRCGVLVCCDCYLARKRGTKYKSVNAITKPTRTRKRFKAGLDINLWPLCLNNQIHDIDKMIITQMSPGNLLDELFNDIHAIRKFYNVSAKCSCCRPQESSEQNNAVERETRLAVGLLQSCPTCNASFVSYTTFAKKIHLSKHMFPDLDDNSKQIVCKECNMETGSGDNLRAHMVLSHHVVDDAYGKAFIEEENKRQESVELQLDQHRKCSVCNQSMHDWDKSAKRRHYTEHLYENILTHINPVPPFVCPECNHIDVSRRRLMQHICIYHKHLDTYLDKYLTEESDNSMHSISSWLDIPNCVFCNERHDNITASQKRFHYLSQHLKGTLVKAINDEYDNILEKYPPYRCRKQGCNFFVDSSKGNSKMRFLVHMGTTHRMVDAFIMDVTKTMITSKSSEPNDDLFSMFSNKCHICDEELGTPDTSGALKAAKAHYHIHFKDDIEERYEDVFTDHQFPLHCPYEGCQFSTEDFDSDQFGHHKKKLIKHLGSFHELFKTFVTQGTSTKKKYDVSYRFGEDLVCKICTKSLPGDFEKKTLHFLDHFKGEIEKEFNEEMLNDTQSSPLKCPFCDETSDVFIQIAIHIGVDHGVFDRMIEDYTRNLDYNKEISCRICAKDFSGALAKSTALKKHYAWHFEKLIEEEHPSVSDGICPICNQRIMSREALVIHIGTNHGYFCKLIEMHHWKEEEEEVDEDVLKEDDAENKVYSMHNDLIQSTCIICGIRIHIQCRDAGKEKEVHTQLSRHLLNHICTIIPGYKTLNCTNCKITFRSKLDLDNHLITQQCLLKYYEKLFSCQKVASNPIFECFTAAQLDYTRPSRNMCNLMNNSGMINMRNGVFVCPHETLANCPVCFSDFRSVDKMTVKLHLARHFAADILADTKRDAPFDCSSCEKVFESRFLLFLHQILAHNVVDKILLQFHRGALSVNVQEGKTKGEVNRYTLLKNSDRFKSMCLLCGSDDVRLASLDRLKVEGLQSKETILNKGLGLHLLRKHLHDILPGLQSPENNCLLCGLSIRSQEHLVDHIASDHEEHVNYILGNISGVDQGQEQFTYSDFFIGFENQGYTDLNLIDLEMLLSEEQNGVPNLTVDAAPVSTDAEKESLKRKTTGFETGSVKRIKMNEVIETTRHDKAVLCDICNFFVSRKKIHLHVLKHVWTEIGEGFRELDRDCPMCHKDFLDFEQLMLHIGIDHNYAESIYKKLETHKLAGKKREFYETLSDSVPSKCKLCDFSIKKTAGRIFETFWKHLVQKHAGVFSFLEFPGCTGCNIIITGSNTTYATLCHFMVEHSTLVENIIDNAVSGDWLNLGKTYCELCTDTQSMETPNAKRKHLVEKHFLDNLIEEIDSDKKIFKCTPKCGCTFLNIEDLAKHWGIEHKAVDKHLPRELISRDHGEESIDATMCVLCSLPIKTADVKCHLLTHLFVGSIVPRMNLTKCPVKNCSFASVGRDGPVYGQVLSHMCTEHFNIFLEEFLTPDVNTMLSSPVRLFEFKQSIHQLLQSELCILCVHPMHINPKEHIEKHELEFMEATASYEDPFQCDFCDGFPSFNTSKDLRCHIVGKHYNVVNKLKALNSPQKIEEKRKLLHKTSGSVNESKLLGKRKLQEKELFDCHIENCEGYDPNIFYSHYSQHFYELILRDLSTEKSGDSSLLTCPRCKFTGKQFDELFNHFGRQHSIVDFYLSRSKLPAPARLNQGGNNCIVCGRVSKPGLQRNTDAESVCTVCRTELGSRLELIANLAKHRPQIDDESGEVDRPGSQENDSGNSVPANNRLALALEDLIEDDDDTDNGGMLASNSLQKMLKAEKVNLGVYNDHPAEESVEEPGLTTLSPRHILTLQESHRISSEAQHSWLCDGRLLHLLDAVSPHNNELFKQQWARGQPVIISNSDQYLNRRLWHPKAFLKDFEEHSADLVNTLTGKTVPNQPLKWFWEGFSSVSQRLVDAEGTPMLLKLKDWPPDGDIAENLPKRYHDLIHDFPIQSYTLREGKLNLASYMPDYFLKPELGPKLYIAYGNALYSERASTNLHLDMSDAVNLLVYVGLPDDCDPQENIKVVLEQVDEAGCDVIMRRRVREEGRLPGAIWHIFHPGDTNKIRDLLIKVALEKGKRLDPHDDPIHDQSTYLDSRLRKRLFEEYGVQSYTIIQCAGDTVFIPAGACHQVRNLHNCIKIAEDFVSPELASNCLHLTQEFRHLTEHHTNHEDKLQIKNIIYHSVKTAVARLKKKMGEDSKQKDT